MKKKIKFFGLQPRKIITKQNPNAKKTLQGVWGLLVGLGELFFNLSAKSKTNTSKSYNFFLLQYLITFLSQIFFKQKISPPQKISGHKVAKFHSKEIQKPKSLRLFEVFCF
jgi:hypothetical protein